jgi:hypothetical protein
MTLLQTSGAHSVLCVTRSITTHVENIFSIAELAESVECGADRIKGISTAQGLRNDVMDTGNLDYRSNGTPCNNPSPLLCRLKEYMFSAKQPMYLMCNRSRGEGDMHEVFFGLFNRLRDRYRHFGGLSFPDADPSLSIPNDNQGTEVEPLSTLHDFRHAVDKDNLVLKA